MKRIAIIIFALLLASGFAYAKDYTVMKKAGSYAVQVKLDKNPPVTGQNKMEISIKDAAGADVTDAAVTVDYSMPAMPGMPAMAYKADTMSHGNGYHTVLNISMKGPWYVNIKITSQEKTVSTKFTFDAN